MAKQTGFLPIKGVFGGASWYQDKKGNNLVKALSPGFGERVKTDAAFENTRKNSSEFGWCAALAGRLIGVISQRWRYILKSSSVGAYTKYIYKLLREYGSGTYGGRVLSPAHKSLVYEGYNKLIKNSVPFSVKKWQAEAIYEYDESPTGWMWDIATLLLTSADMEEELLQEGATHLACGLYAVQIDLNDESDGGSGVRVVPIQRPTEFVELDGQGDKLLVDTMSKDLSRFVQDANNTGVYSCTCVLLFPARVSYSAEGEETQYAILQRLCAANIEQVAYSAPRSGSAIQIITSLTPESAGQVHGGGWYYLGDLMDIYVTDNEGNKITCWVRERLYMGSILMEDDMGEFDEIYGEVEPGMFSWITKAILDFYIGGGIIQSQFYDYEGEVVEIITDKLWYQIGETATVHLENYAEVYFHIDRFNVDGSFRDALEVFGTSASFEVFGKCRCYISTESLGTPVNSLVLNLPDDLRLEYNIWMPFLVGYELFFEAKTKYGTILVNWERVVDGETATPDHSRYIWFRLGLNNMITCTYRSDNMVQIITKVNPYNCCSLDAPVLVRDGQDVAITASDFYGDMQPSKWLVKTDYGTTETIAYDAFLYQEINHYDSDTYEITLECTGTAEQVKLELESTFVSEDELEGAGMYILNTLAHIKAPATYDGHAFVGWYKNGDTLFAESNEYDFTIEEELTLIAEYE